MSYFMEAISMLDRLKQIWQRVREANQFETETIQMLPYA